MAENTKQPKNSDFNMDLNQIAYMSLKGWIKITRDSTDKDWEYYGYFGKFPISGKTYTKDSEVAKVKAINNAKLLGRI